MVHQVVEVAEVGAVAVLECLPAAGMKKSIL